MKISVLFAGMMLASMGLAQPAERPPTEVTGVIDGFYSANFNRPDPAINLFHNFDAPPGFQLNAAQISIVHDAPSWGFEIDAGTGEMFRIMNAPDPWHGPNRYISQALVTYKHDRLKLDFGKFYSSIGAEAPGSNKNSNYTRSLLYVLGEPYDHFGLRASLRVTKLFTAGVQVVNGWNDVRDNNTGKSIALTSSWTSEKWSWSQVYMFGPERGGTTQGGRRSFNSVLTLSPSSRWTGYVELLYATDGAFGATAASNWSGVAGSARYAISKKWSVSPRLERFNDPQGVLTGAPRTIHEGTATIEYQPSAHCIVRAEARRDSSGVPVFPAQAGSPVRGNQDTFLIAVIGTIKSSDRF